MELESIVNTSRITPVMENTYMITTPTESYQKPKKTNSLESIKDGIKRAGNYLKDRFPYPALNPPAYSPVPVRARY